MALDVQNCSSTVLVLDAMGVIYKVGDDVADLLIPFIREHGGLADSAGIETLYTEASLGRMPASEFWQRVGVSNELEDQYLARFRLSDGLPEFLHLAARGFERIACLSNDLLEWSRKLRRQFGLESHFAAWYISGELGVRKPDRRIYERMLDALRIDPRQVVFVDDRVKNLDAAAELGIQTVYFDVTGIGNGGGHRPISRLAEVLDHYVHRSHQR